MKRFLILAVFFFAILSLTACAAKTTTEVKPVKVFGTGVANITVQYVDEKGEVVTNKKDKSEDEHTDSCGCMSSCCPFGM